MFFRPMPILTLVLLPALALLIGLGIWQWDRMDEKAAAIEAWESRQDEQALDLSTALCFISASAYRRLVNAPDAVSDAQLRFQGRSAAGEPGWRIMAPVVVPECFDVANGEFALIQTGFESLRGERTRITGPVMVFRPPEAGAFTAVNLPDSDEFYRFNRDQFAEALGVTSVTDDFWLLESIDGLPPELATVPPSQHLGYALTWWGLALALIAVFLVMHVQAGRLGFTRR